MKAICPSCKSQNLSWLAFGTWECSTCDTVCEAPYRLTDAELIELFKPTDDMWVVEWNGVPVSAHSARELCGETTVRSNCVGYCRAFQVRFDVQPVLGAKRASDIAKSHAIKRHRALQAG